MDTAPDKIALPFAESGGRRTIPIPSQILITPAAASYTDGFPPITRIPAEDGGLPPYGIDMNGILFALSSGVRWLNAGGGYPYDSAFATAPEVAGYPAGARVMQADADGYWLNTLDGNDTNPESTTAGEAATAGWRPEFCSALAVAIPDATVTLTPAQYGKELLILSGALTGNRSLYFPDIDGKWTVVNNCTGNFSVLLRTQSGSEIVNSMPGKSIVLAVENGEVKDASLSGLQAAAYREVSATGNVAYSDLGGVISSGAAANIVLTLPTVTGVRPGARVDFLNPTAYTVTITAFSGQSIVNALGTSASTVVMYPGDTLTLECPQSSNWVAVGGTAASKAATPYSAGGGFVIPLAGSVMLQCGSITLAGQATVDVTLPVAAVTGIPFCVACKGFAISTTAEYGVGAQPLGTTAITIRNSSLTTADQLIYWMAITY